MERVVGEGRSGRGGKAMETGRMAKKKGRRRQECNRKPGGRKAGARRGETGQGGGGSQERKGVRRESQGWGKEWGNPLPHPALDTPRSPTGFQRLDFGGLEEEREHFWARGQGKDGWKLPAFGVPASLHIPARLLGKIPLLHREI